MKEMRRVLSLFLCLVMLFGLVPIGVFAEDNLNNEDTQAPETVAEETVPETEAASAPVAMQSGTKKSNDTSDDELQSGTDATEPETEPEPEPETEPATEPEETKGNDTSDDELLDGEEATEPATEPEEEIFEVEPEYAGYDSNPSPIPAAALGSRELPTYDEIEAALTEALSYIDAITVNNSSNDPATVVGNYGTHFTWDNEKRESGKSYLYDWSYYNGVVFEGVEYLYEATGSSKYKNYVVEYMQTLIASDGTWAKCTNNSSKTAAGYVSYHGADCYKTASLLLDAYTMTGDSRYLTMAATLYNDLDTAANTYLLPNAGNNYHHTWQSASSPNLWLDGLYMIMPFQAEYAKYTGDTEELQEIVDRLTWVSNNMYDSTSGLFYHAANSASSNSGTFWLRSIGWYAAAIVDVMDSVSPSQRATLAAQLTKLADGLNGHRNEYGMWLNNMKAEESSSNPYETSGTALVCYAILKAVNNGWIDESYAEMALNGMVGICDHKLSGATLTDICFKGAPGSSNSTFYNNEGKGVGPFIMLTAEVQKYQNAHPSINTVETDSENGLNHFTATAAGLTKIEAVDVYEDVESIIAAKLDLDAYTYSVAYDLQLTGNISGQEVTYTALVEGGMSDEDLVLYHVAADGTMTKLDYTLDTSNEDELPVISFTTSLTGIFAFGPEKTQVGEGETLSKVEVTTLPATLKYFRVDDQSILPMDIVDMEVTATFSGGSTKVIYWNEFGEIADGYSLTVDMTKNGKQDVVVSYTYQDVTLTDSFEITICDQRFVYPPVADGDPVVSVELTVPGVTGLEIQNNTKAAFVVNAVGTLMTEYVAYDIQLVGHEDGQSVSVTMPLPEGEGEAVVYYVPLDGSKAQKLSDENVVDNGDGTVTFVTDHFSTYASGRAATAVTGTTTIVGATNVGSSQNNVTEITSGAYYQLYNTKSNDYLQGTANGNDRTKLALDTNSEQYWYITHVSGNTYYVQYGGPDGLYLTFGANASSLTDTATALTLNYVTSQSCWEIQLGDRYLNDYNGDGNRVAGWTGNAAGDNGSRWQLNLISSKTYTLDTDGMDPGANYIIVGSDNDIALTLSGTTVGNANVDVNGNSVTILGDSSAYEFYFANNSAEANTYLLTQNGTSTIYHSGGNMNYGQDNKGYWYVAHQTDGSYQVYDYDNNNWYLNYGYVWGNDPVERFSVSSNARTVRLYKEVADSANSTKIDFSVTPGQLNLVAGRMNVLVPDVFVNDEEVSDYTITWASTNESVATVNSVGVIQGLTPGTTKITATLTKAGDHSLGSQSITLEIDVTVVPTTIESLGVLGSTDNTASGTVYVGSAGTARTGSVLLVVHGTGDNAVTMNVAVTLNMLRDAEGNEVNVSEVGTQTGLKIVYQGEVWPGTYTLNVVPRPDENHPDYPNPGSVTVTKGAVDTSYFQNVGVAEIQLTASGIPMRNDVDVLLVLDLSNSMAWKNESREDAASFEDTKMYDLQQAVNEFTNILLAPNADGSPIRNTMGVVTFGGYDADHVQLDEDGNIIHNGNYADVTQTLVEFTNNPAYVRGAVNNIRLVTDGVLGETVYDGGYALSFDGGQTYMGNYGNTNYDYAFMQAHEAITTFKNRYAANYGQTYAQSGRELYVVFMTDGAPTNYNGVYYRYRATNDRNGPDVRATWTPNGDPGAADELYTWGTGTATYTNAAWETYIEGQDLAWAKTVGDEVTEIINVGFETGYGGFTVGNTLWTFDDLDNVLAGMVAGKTLEVHNATGDEELTEIYKQLATQITQAATKSYFADQMGGSFNLESRAYLTKFDKVNNVEYTVALNPAPKITISTYNIFKSAQVGTTMTYTENGVSKTVTVTGEMVGQAYGDPKVLETVYFSADGTKAFSDQIGTITTSTITPTDENGPLKDAAGNAITVTEYSGTDILGADGVIDGKHFYYNTTSSSVYIDLDRDGDGVVDIEDYELEPETFCWKIGTIQDQKFVMSYYVALEGAAEGQASAGSYATNNFAELHYVNWKGEEVDKEVQTPSVTWESVAVSYGFYLVDQYGRPVADRATGTLATDFGSAYRVTNVIPYDTVKLNATGTVELALDITSVLPEGYKVYDTGASYRVYVDSNNTASGWDITNSKTPDTTYVENYHGNDYTNKDSSAVDPTRAYDYSNTVVWFAVVWEPHAIPDVVVIDYGLPVDINVLHNDIFGAKGSIHGIGTLNMVPTYVNEDGETVSKLDSTTWGTSAAAGFGNSQSAAATENDKLEYGNIEIVGTEVRYTPTSMQMPTYDKFAYEVLYYNTNATSGEEVAEYYYGSVTVIPATTIYYEDTYKGSSNTYSFIRFDDSGAAANWTDVGTTLSGVQAEDRPGVISLPAIDANNIYGYDGVNSPMATHSMGSAKMIHLNTGEYATAEFDFYGTGFDVISVTSNDTGTMLLEVTDLTNNTVECRSIIKTYYGYEYTACDVKYVLTDGEWVKEGVIEKTTGQYTATTLPATDGYEEGEYVVIVHDDWIVVDSTNPNAIYQVPILKIYGLDYGKYRAKLIASYNAYDDKTAAAGYDLYVDAIRIYDPAGTTYAPDASGDNTVSDNIDDVIENAYIADGEGWPQYLEIRNQLIDEATYKNADDTTQFKGAVFIDGQASEYKVAHYTSYGPNNEVYLAAGQAIAFELDLRGFVKQVDTTTNKNMVAGIHIGAKSATGGSVNLSVTTESVTNHVIPIATTTDMYYDLTQYMDLGANVGATGTDIPNDAKTIVTITNTGSGVMSLTNVKITFKENPLGTETAEMPAVMRMSRPMAAAVVEELNAAANVEENEPEATEPEVTEPEAFVPEKLVISVNRSSVKVGSKVAVTVKTGSDVQSITVNGVEVTKFSSNRRTGERTWKLDVKAETAGNLAICVVAYNEDGQACEPVEKTIWVSPANNGNNGSNSNNGNKKNPAEQILETIISIVSNLFKKR